MIDMVKLANNLVINKPLTAEELEVFKRSDSDLVCPFCKEDLDGLFFDMPGLKHHLIMDCEVYEKTENI